MVTLRSYYRDRQQAVMQAEHRGMPIFVLRANTVSQMEQFLSDLFNLSEMAPAAAEMDEVKLQAQAAIAAVLNGERWVDLPPGPATERRLQHELARDAELVSHSYGKEPRRHVRIFQRITIIVGHGVAVPLPIWINDVHHPGRPGWFRQNLPRQTPGRMAGGTGLPCPYRP